MIQLSVSMCGPEIVLGMWELVWLPGVHQSDNFFFFFFEEYLYEQFFSQHFTAAQILISRITMMKL